MIFASLGRLATGLKMGSLRKTSVLGRTLTDLRGRCCCVRKVRGGSVREERAEGLSPFVGLFAALAASKDRSGCEMADLGVLRIPIAKDALTVVSPSLEVERSGNFECFWTGVFSTETVEVGEGIKGFILGSKP